MPRVYVGDLWIHAVDRGLGAPVLLVHGFPLDHRMWSDQIDVLSTRHRVIAPDLRGFGESYGAAGVTTMERFADDLRLVLDQLRVDEPVAFCGLSMGGYIALEFWRRHGVRVRSLALCDTRAIADSPDAARNRRLLADRILATGTDTLADEMLPKLVAPSTLANQPQTVARIREMIAKAEAPGVAAALRGMAERRDSTSTLAEINVPTMCLVGEYDAISPPDEMRDIAANISDAQFIVVPEAGHMTTMENPGAVNDALLAFLAR
jgi:pimeloyl-ACP methyl ester carboxylesterase